MRLVTGPIRSGKTTRLAAWASDRTDVGGVLSPDGADGRAFVDLRSGERVHMERPGPGEPAIGVGRFVFRAGAFDWASARVSDAARDPALALVVIDEIGRLELTGEGFAPLLHALLPRERRAALVLVVRDTLLDAVRATFGLHDAETWDLV